MVCPSVYPSPFYLCRLRHGCPQCMILLCTGMITFVSLQGIVGTKLLSHGTKRLFSPLRLRIHHLLSCRVSTCIIRISGTVTYGALLLFNRVWHYEHNAPA
jgi:hypothetical protein